MDIETLLKDSRAESLVEPLGFKTETGRTQFKRQLRLWTANLGVLQRRQDVLQSFKGCLTKELDTELSDIFQEVNCLEPDCKIFFQKSDVEKDSYGQLLFSGWLQALNTIPFVLLALSVFKQFIVPALAVLTPLFMIIMPFFLLRYWYSLPLSPSEYTKLLLNVVGVQNLSLSNPRAVLQGGLTLFSLGQSIYQPIQNALHLQTIHKDLLTKAKSVQRLFHIVNQLKAISVPQPRVCLMEESMDVHRLFADVWDNPYTLKLALQTIGDFEVLYRLAKIPHLHAVCLLGGDKPHLSVDQGLDPFVSTPVPFRFHLAKTNPHAILTGPNRGGKSSVLRSTLLTVVLGQTFGVAFSKEPAAVQLRPFDWIASGLRLEDRPGQTSMFEREVEFAVQIVQRAKQQPSQIGFVVFDELFHSTNPPDGAYTAELFLHQVWKQSNLASFISTHVFSLAKQSPASVQKLCVPAYKTKAGTLRFTYTLRKGICEVSSVDEILREKRLLV
jgi:hypothetical protein